MASLRAWGQGNGAPAYLQVVQRPALHRLSESGETCIANVVAIKEKCLHMAH